MSFDRESYVEAGRREIRNSVASLEDRIGHSRHPVTEATLTYVIDAHEVNGQRLEAEVQLTKERVAALRTLRARMRTTTAD